ncbi:MAG: hypothetical protein ACYTEK_26710 [Planctomycetota bacterium]|jgi:hypothetical protein
MLTDYYIFARARAPQRGRTYEPGDYDLRLHERINVLDVGVVLPQITDGFTGEAPDLGCYELGQEPPHYGPRPL